MLCGPFMGYKLEQIEQMNDPSFITPVQLELMREQKRLGFDMALNPRDWSYDDTREAIGALMIELYYSFSIYRSRAPENAGMYLIDAALLEQELTCGGWCPKRVTIEGATFAELLQKLKDVLAADFAKLVAPLGLEVAVKQAAVRTSTPPPGAYC